MIELCDSIDDVSFCYDLLFLFFLLFLFLASSRWVPTISQGNRFLLHCETFRFLSLSRADVWRHQRLIRILNRGNKVLFSAFDLGSFRLRLGKWHDCGRFDTNG